MDQHTGIKHLRNAQYAILLWSYSKILANAYHNIQYWLMILKEFTARNAQLFNTITALNKNANLVQMENISIQLIIHAQNAQLISLFLQVHLVTAVLQDHFIILPLKNVKPVWEVKYM